MVRPGPLPKDESKRERVNAPTFDQVELDANAKVDAPELPAGSWSPGVLRWYAAFSASPMAAQLLPFDWERVFAIALLRQVFEANPSAALMAEIRQNEAKLGGTPDDRLRLRWRLAENRHVEEQAAKPPERKSSRGRTDPRLALVEDAS